MIVENTLVNHTQKMCEITNEYTNSKTNYIILIVVGKSRLLH